MTNQKIATVFGGTGFIGRYVVRGLAQAGYTVKIATRVPARAYFLRPYGVVGQIVPVLCDHNDQADIDAAISGADVVVNCVGVLYERRRGDFRRLHTDLPRMIAESCARSGAKRFVHVSALGVDGGKSRYALTKRDGERAVAAAFPLATILRPSVVFGPEDRFFNMFAGLARFTPVLPLIGGGKTRFQPVYVGDVAAAVMAAVTLPAAGADTPQGAVYALGGPDVVTLRDVYRLIAGWTGRSRLLLPLPFVMATVMAAVLRFVPPRPLLTPDQVKALRTDTVADGKLPGLAALGIVPTAMVLVVPGYLERFRDGGRFAANRAA